MSTDTAPHKKVIVFNGPPGVGKDTAVKACLSYLYTHTPWYQARHMKFAEPLKRATHMLYGLNHWDWDHFDKPEFVKYKNVPCGEFMGMSPREAYISMSENYAKTIDPLFFGWIARRKMGATTSSVFMFSDSGFIDELTPIVDWVTPSSLMIVELHAEGKSYSGDSRGYIGDAAKERWPKCTVKKIKNDFGDRQDEELFKVFCKGAVKGFLNIEEKE